MDRRCGTCKWFMEWEMSFVIAPEGVCGAPFPDLPVAQPNRERRKYDGQKCQTWATRPRESRDE